MAITSAPDASLAQGRPDSGAARARTEALYAAHGGTVRALCRVLLRDRAEAEDAAQQTFLSAHRALLNGSEPQEPSAWLATIARNECWGRVRARMREPLPTHELDGPDLRSDPLAETIRHADIRALWQAIEALPTQQRDALLLRELGGLSYDELAGALAVSGPAVESLLFRARQRLRAQLKVAYGAVSGAGWVEGLARLLAGGSGVAAPVAAKVAAVGVGAAVVAGGAVVAPSVLEHRPHARTPARPSTISTTTARSRPAAGAVVPAGGTATSSRHDRTAQPQQAAFVPLPGSGTERRDDGGDAPSPQLGGGHQSDGTQSDGGGSDGASSDGSRSDGAESGRGGATGPALSPTTQREDDGATRDGESGQTEKTQTGTIETGKTQTGKTQTGKTESGDDGTSGQGEDGEGDSATTTTTMTSTIGTSPVLKTGGGDGGGSGGQDGGGSTGGGSDGSAGGSGD